MKKLIPIGLILLIIGCTTNNELKPQNDNSPAIMAYYVPSKLPVDSLPLAKLTHIIFSFTEVVDNEMKIRGSRIEPRLVELVKAAEKYPNLKLMAACGGWGGSGGFSEMASSPETREKFVKSSIEFMKKYNLSGLDMDWEYPGLPGIGNPYKPEDKENFTLLMKELKQAMQAVDKSWILTFASAGWEGYYEHVEILDVMKYADYMNIMTYDFVGGNTPYSSHHTNLGSIKKADLVNTPAGTYLDSINYAPRSTEDIVAYCIENGVNPNQIVIGGAFYGKIWKGVSPDNNGLYQPTKGFEGYATFDEISTKYLNDRNFTEYWDPIGKAPYLFNKSDSLFLSYDNQKSIELKSRFVKEKDLGGIMFWQLSQDSDDFQLVNSIYNTFN